MFKITWGKSSDEFDRVYIIAPDAKSLFAIWFVITGYGRNDGCTPVNVRVTNLDGVEVDMSRGLACAASRA